MCTMGQCQGHLGQWVQFETPWGQHHGVVEQVTAGGVLMRVPRQYAPVGIASLPSFSGQTDEQKLDVVLAQWGYGPGYGAPGYGYRAWWAGAWLFWWLAFALILGLAFLW